MTDKLPTAKELFEKYRPMFREVELFPCMLKTYSDGIKETIEQKKVLLYLSHIGKTPHMITGRNSMYFDMCLSPVNFSVKYSTEEESWEKYEKSLKFEHALWDEIKKTYFSNRRFFIDPLGDIFPVKYKSYNFQFFIDGNEIPGLIIDKMFTEIELKWEDFIPEGDERNIIESAVKYEDEIRKSKNSISQTEKSISELKTSFEKRLQELS